MIKASLAAMGMVMLTYGGAEAQTSKDSGGKPRLLTVDEIIKVLPGRWEYREDDGWKTGSNASEKVSCDGAAERIWFERDAQGLIYHSKKESPDAKENRSRVRFDRLLIFERPVIRIQYEGEQRLDENGKPVAWELFMPDPDTFYWHRVGWPPGATTAIVRRCKEEVVS